MGKTSTASKNKYNSKAYDQIPLRVPKGKKQEIREHADGLNKSLNSYIVELIDNDMGNKE